MDFKYLAIGFCVALGVFLLIAETRRKQKAHLIWRLLASTIAVICFYCLLYPPSFTDKRKAGAQEINLLNGDVADGLVIGSSNQSAPKSVSVNTLKGLTYSIDHQFFMKNRKAGVRFVPDLEYFLKSNPDLQVIHLYGKGLSPDQLQLLKGKQLSFHPGPVRDGLTAINWNGQLTPSSELIIQGTYQHTGGTAPKLLLEGLGTKLDSVSVTEKGLQTFTLKAIPQQSGKAVFRIIGMKGKDTLFTNPVPIEIKPSHPVRILMLASNPDFEYKFLKNWLFEKKYPLIFRSRISKDKYSTDFLNTDVNEFQVITAGLLKKMDLLILDEEELAQLSGTERAHIKQALDNGLGLFMRVSSVKSSAGIANGSSRYESESLKNKPLHAGFTNHGPVLSALPVEQLLFLKAGNDDQPLFQEATGKILVNSQIYGMGRQTVSVLPATYQWMLNGAAGDYARFWSAMVNKTARPAEAKEKWTISPGIPELTDRLHISISLPQGGAVPLFKTAGEISSPLQNRELATQWQLNSWATQPGWNTFQAGDLTDAFYVYQKSDWQQLRETQQQLATSQFVKDHPIHDKVVEKSILLDKKLSLWWFFIPFLLSVSFLWYETKML
ncbi:hypothetical protein [Pedobacter polysacchareus]|uniref:hypothetical protein n=1 Tax=Pedobacter polysacchareus TaxID=2861973 RepID=UPI001C99DF33|nr:hypothetical protein [Pedobacter polysacchareus]